MNKTIIELEITDSMYKSVDNCGEDGNCDDCECRIGNDDCIFNHEIEDQGKIFHFPVKVGDSIYLLTNERIDPCEIIELHIGKYVKGISIFNPIIGIVKVALVEMGKMIFLTKEEAEAALKKKQEGEK